jgi:plasmid maintenance system antidote protein VapI
MQNERVLEEPLVNATEAARLLNVPRTTVYELVRPRGLPHLGADQRPRLPD